MTLNFKSSCLSPLLRVGLWVCPTRPGLRSAGDGAQGVTQLGQHSEPPPPPQALRLYLCKALHGAGTAAMSCRPTYLQVSYVVHNSPAFDREALRGDVVVVDLKADSCVSAGLCHAPQCRVKQ